MNYQVNKIVNLTPHSIKIITGDNHDEVSIEIPSSGQIARVKETVCQGFTISFNGFEIETVGKRFDEYNIEGLPDEDEDEDAIYIVSGLVRSALNSSKRGFQRADVFCPGDLVRDSHGLVIGCRNLCQ